MIRWGLPPYGWLTACLHKTLVRIKMGEERLVFCAQHGVIVPAIEQLPAGSLKRLERIDDAVNALISPDPLRKDFLAHQRLVSTLYDAVKPDPVVLEFAGRAACLAAIADAINAKLNPNPVDISKVMGDVIWLTFVKQVICLRSEIFHMLSVCHTANYSESETGTL